MKLLIKEFNYRFLNKSRFLIAYLSSFFWGLIFIKKFRNIESFCLFVGYGRSGHTLVASLLDAHPEIVIGIELDVITHIKLGYNRNQIFYSLIKNSEKYTKKKSNIWSGYKYQVKNSWQGNYRDLKVIGDKQGGLNSTYLFIEPGLLHKTEKVIGIKPKIIHVIRNPFDNITTITLRRLEVNPSYKPIAMDLLPDINKYFRNATVIMNLKKENYYEIIDTYHEDIVRDPIAELKRLIGFFNLEVDQDYLESCSSIIYSQPNKSRYNIEWPIELIQLVEKEVMRYPFLLHYRYNE